MLQGKRISEMSVVERDGWLPGAGEKGGRWVKVVNGYQRPGMR